MKGNGLEARLDRLEKRHCVGLVVAILREGESEAEGRRRVIAECGLIDGPGLCVVLGSELDALL